MTKTYQDHLSDCYHIGHAGSETLRINVFRRHPWLAGALSYRYQYNARKYGFEKADQYLAKLEKALEIAETGLFADSSDTQVKEWAEYQAAKCTRILTLEVTSGDDALVCGERLCQAAGVDFPLTIKKTDTDQEIKQNKIAALARLCDARFWRRKMRKIVATRLETICRQLGLVCKEKGAYVSNYSLARRKQQKARNALLLKDIIAINDQGYSATLEELAEHSQANPNCRRTELMVRMRGYEEISEALGYQGLFITITTPSRFHAMTDGRINPKFDGSTPKQAQDYLCETWAKVRAAWQRKGLKAFGFRIAEPHTDGTPHWHMLLFCHPDHAQELTRITKKHAIATDRQELKSPEALNARFDVQYIDKSKGSATGYIAKYIAKNIDGQKTGKNVKGESVGVDLETGQDVIETCERVEAWASTWSIRQFQQIGAVSVTVWRELRRGIQADLFEGEEQEREVLLAIAEAADRGDWKAFVELMGGALAGRDELVLRPLRVLTDEPNQYGENYQRIKGVIMRGASRMITRWLEWKIQRRPLGFYVSSEVESMTAAEAYFISQREKPPQAEQRSGNRGALDLCK